MGYMRIALFVFIITMFSQAEGDSSFVASAEDIVQCQQFVENYGTAWKNSEYETMFNYLSSKDIGVIGKKGFVRQYSHYSEMEVNVLSFDVESAKSSEDNVVVKVSVQFSKEIGPNLVNGVYSYHMKRVNGVWKIKTILIPVSVPSFNNSQANSHPGM
jgi:hypothetical protein